MCERCEDGSPPPTVEPILASKILLLRASGGVWGDGNDRFKILKGILTTGAPVDLATTHTLHLTMRVDSAVGPVVFQASVPPGPNWTVIGGGSAAE